MRLARNSWMIPIALLAMMSSPKAALMSLPVVRTMTSRMPRMALIRVRTLARTISPVERPLRAGMSFVRPSRTRSATSALVRPG
ncbi:MAG: hypothetical protein BWY91_02478 [bacterium ADurb.BinA028]|nr:MAG: hypothetical protein BWY91_02478 [bacterium ADurb.BinA028]